MVISDPPPTAGLAALWLARRSEARFVYYFCDSWAAVARRGGIPRVVGRVIAALENHCLRRADVVLAAEEALASEALERGARHVELVQNGADVALVDGHAGDVAREPFDDMPYFIYAGTHSEVHGARIFIEASEMLWTAGKRFGVLFVGDGSDSDWLDAYSRQCQFLKRLEPIPLARLAPLLAGARGSLVSLADLPEDYYATPSKIYNALAAGSSIIYSGPRGPVRFLEDNNVGVVLPRDVGAVAQAMLDELNRNARDLTEMRTRARMYARQHRNLDANTLDAATKLRQMVDPKVSTAGRPRGSMEPSASAPGPLASGTLRFEEE